MVKIWLCIFFGYNGANFHGMQHQKQQIATIQDLLISKLHSGGFLTTDRYYQLQKQYSWSRAARTDKGVHAINNAISCLFSIDEKYFEEDHTLNKNKLHLDLKDAFQNTQIVYHCVKRVTTRFEVRLLVKSRQYSYICPKSYFVPPGKTADNQSILTKIRKCCSQFVGTHNFHNYSKGLKAKDPQAKRYILSFNCQILDQNFVIFKISGQSFVYHQIRKMIGSIIMIAVNEYDHSFIANTFFRNQINIPLAPPFGLYLQTLNFDSYNKKNDKPEPLVFWQADQSITRLRESIIKDIQATESEKWSSWLQTLIEGIKKDDFTELLIKEEEINAKQQETGDS